MKSFLLVVADIIAGICLTLSVIAIIFGIAVNDTMTTKALIIGVAAVVFAISLWAIRKTKGSAFLAMLEIISPW